jgi:glycosyltransferase involved in cell wall biosynthesis
MNTAGMSWGLSRAERALGLESDVLVLRQTYLEYPADRVVLPRKTFWNKKLRSLVLLREALRIRKLYDVFHFNYGTTLIDKWRKGRPLLDLPLYKGRGRIAVTYNGCDARQKHPTMDRVPFSACHDPSCYGGKCSPRSDELKQKRIEKFGRFADVIFAVNPDLLHFLPERSEFLPYTIPNWDVIETRPWRPPGDRFRIVHAPTDRAAKGSDIIIAALERLENRYRDRVRFTLVENMPNAEALEIYARADLIVDQVVVGWYGSLAVEAMRMGTSVMAFVRDEDLVFLPPGMADGCRAAIINADPDTIFDKLCRLIENPAILRDHREAGLEYVNAWHSPAVVAGMTKAAYERKGPPASRPIKN